MIPPASDTGGVEYQRNLIFFGNEHIQLWEAGYFCQVSKAMKLNDRDLAGTVTGGVSNPIRMELVLTMR